MLIMDNASGKGPGSQVPAEVAGKFNWGVFFCTWIWGICNKTYITFIALGVSILSAIIPFLGLANIALAVWFGVKGNEWAWQNKEWESVEAFHSHQKKWAIAGILLFVLSIVLGLLFGFAAIFSIMNSAH